MRENIRINRIRGLGHFLRNLHADTRWPEDDSARPDDPRLRGSSLVPPSASNFADFLEPRIRPLVLAVVGSWACTTFSSCEGHPARGHIPASAATVGILPLDCHELARTTVLVERFRRNTVNAFIAAGIDTVICEVDFATVESAAGSFPTVEVWFVPDAHSAPRWARYFEQLDQAIDEALGCLQ
ncbi:hypothetical protein ACFWVM_01280 [Nocardia fluminea]|uniref:hypothetical protein n=1 Tax=Nocardia fluminea TaxID=134984 RepID=UPI00364784E7